MIELKPVIRPEVELKAIELTEGVWQQIESLKDHCAYFGKFYIMTLPKSHSFTLNTLEGIMKAKIGYFMIQGSCGEIWAVAPEVFKKTYYFKEKI